MQRMLKQGKDGVELRVKVTPKSSKNAIVGWEEDLLKVRLRAIPEKGNANEALIELLSEFFCSSIQDLHFIGTH